MDYGHGYDADSRPASAAGVQDDGIVRICGLRFARNSRACARHAQATSLQMNCTASRRRRSVD
jgi:hypothetical protein